MKPKRPAALLFQRGVAVITALLLTTLAITIVASLFWQQQVQVRSIENQRLQLQKQWVLRGALDWARLILREDAKYSTIDGLNEPWAVELANTRLDQYVDDERLDDDVANTALSGKIVDAQGLFNLTNLATNGVINPDQVGVFQRLLEQLQLTSNGNLAQTTAQILAAGQSAQAAAGAPSPGTPLGSGPAASAASASSTAAQTVGFTQVDDLLAVPGLSPGNYQKLKPFVTVLPRATKLNVNTAPTEVLSAVIQSLTPSAAAALVVNRARAGFRDITDLRGQLPGITLDDSQIVFSTSFFLVSGTVRIGRAALQMLALIERNGSNTNIVWIREN